MREARLKAPTEQGKAQRREQPLVI